MSATAAAQATVGEVLDAGGKKLAKVELVKLIAGATVSGQTQGDGQIQLDIKADGTFTGMMTQNQEMTGNSGRFGTWTVDDAGLFCTDNTAYINGASSKNCVYYYVLGDKYFISFDTDDRGARVFERFIKK